MDRVHAPAEVAALRTVMGLSQDQLAVMLGVNTSSVRAWENGKLRMSPSSSGALDELMVRHLDLTDQIIGQKDFRLRRLPADYDSPPRGWFLAAAGRAITEDILHTSLMWEPE